MPATDLTFEPLSTLESAERAVAEDGRMCLARGAQPPRLLRSAPSPTGFLVPEGRVMGRFLSTASLRQGDASRYIRYCYERHFGPPGEPGKVPRPPRKRKR